MFPCAGAPAWAGIHIIYSVKYKIVWKKMKMWKKWKKCEK